MQKVSASLRAWLLFLVSKPSAPAVPVNIMLATREMSALKPDLVEANAIRDGLNKFRMRSMQA